MSSHSRIYNIESFLFGLGFSLIFVWTFILDSAPSTFFAISDTSISSKLLSILVAILCAILWKPLELIQGRTIAFSVVIVTGGMCTIFAFTSSLINGFVSALWLISLLRSITVIVLTALWANYFGRLPLFQVIFTIATSFVAATLIDGAISLLPPSSLFGIALLLPLLSALCLRCAHWRLDESKQLYICSKQPSSSLGKAFVRRSEPATTAQELRTIFPWQLLCLIIAYSFAIGIIRVQGNLNTNVISFGVAGVIIFTAVIIGGSKGSVHSIAGISIPIMLLGLFIAALTGSASPTLVQVSVNTATAMITAFSLIEASDRGYRFGFSSIFLTCIFRAATLATSLLGTLLMRSIVPSAENFISSTPIYIIAFALVIAATAFWFRNPSSSNSPLIIPNEFVDEIAANNTQTPRLSNENIAEGITSYRSLIVARCLCIAEDGNLSPREHEVLLCLARGMSIPRIEEELVISNNTVKTHISHIYRKLGIHSRDELKILLDVE